MNSVNTGPAKYGYRNIWAPIHNKLIAAAFLYSSKFSAGLLQRIRDDLTFRACKCIDRSKEGTCRDETGRQSDKIVLVDGIWSSILSHGTVHSFNSEQRLFYGEFIRCTNGPPYPGTLLHRAAATTKRHRRGSVILKSDQQGRPSIRPV